MAGPAFFANVFARFRKSVSGLIEGFDGQRWVRIVTDAGDVGSVSYQYSVDGLTNWHSQFVPGVDHYYRVLTYGNPNPGPAIATSVGMAGIRCTTPVIFRRVVNGVDTYIPASTVTFSAIKDDGSTYAGRWKVYRGARLIYSGIADVDHVDVPVAAVATDNAVVAPWIAELSYSDSASGSEPLRAELYAAGALTTKVSQFQTATLVDVDSSASAGVPVAVAQANVYTDVVGATTTAVAAADAQLKADVVKAYSDGIVDAEEAQRIYVDQQNLNTALAAAAAAEANAKAATASLVPRYRGRYQYGSVAAGVLVDDTCLIWDSDTTPGGHCGIFKWNGSTWINQYATPPTTKMISDAWPDILWAVTNSHPANDDASCKLYMGSAVNYFALLAINTAFINNLFVQALVLLSGGTFQSSNYVASTSGFKLTGSSGLAEFVNILLSGNLATGGSLAGTKFSLDNSGLEIWSGASKTSPAVGDFKFSASATYTRVYNCVSAGAWNLLNDLRANLRSPDFGSASLIASGMCQFGGIRFNNNTTSNRSSDVAGSAIWSDLNAAIKVQGYQQLIQGWIKLSGGYYISVFSVYQGPAGNHDITIYGLGPAGTVTYTLTSADATQYSCLLFIPYGG